MHTVSDLRPADALAVRATVAVAARVTPADLGRPTPCAGWDLRALLDHMTAQHHEFAAAVAGDDQGQDPAGYAASAARVVDVFAAGGSLDRPVTVPSLGGRPFPLRLVVAFHLVDFVVHGWDLARTLGEPWELPPPVLQAALAIARAVPDDDRRTRPGAAFAPAVPTTPGADTMDEILTRLGRSPTWQPDGRARAGQTPGT